MSAVLRRSVTALTALAVAAVVTAAPPVAAEPPAEGELRIVFAGDSLDQDEVLVSDSGRSRLTITSIPRLQVVQEANWIESRERSRYLTHDGDWLWSEYNSDPVDRLHLTEDGELIALHGPQTVWSWDTGGQGIAAFVLGDDGSILLLDENGDVVSGLNTRPSFLLSHDALLPGDVVESDDGRSALVMQEDGNLVHYVEGRPAWWSGTAGNPGAAAVLQPDGNLVVYSSPEVGVRALSQTGTLAAHGYPCSCAVASHLQVEPFELSLTGAYNWIHMRHGPFVVWGTAWGSDVVRSGDALQLGDRRRSSDGRCTLVLQRDRNLVEYCDGRAVWWTATTSEEWDWAMSSPDAAELAMQADGNLVLYTWWRDADLNPRFGPLWFTGTTVAGSRLVVQNDSNVVLYAPNGTPTWSRATGRLR